MEAAERIKRLKKEINHHRYLYHVLDRQEISDSALDSLKQELFDLEQKHPEFITLDSPTQRVGGKPLEKFEKFRHPYPMLSFNDAFSEKDVKDWEERIKKLLFTPQKNKFGEGLPKTELNYYCELKIDGLAIEMVYNREIFSVGSTRGDGFVGENVSQNLKMIEAIPLKIREKNEIISELKESGLKKIAENLERKWPQKLIVRGEVFITKKEFERVNKEREKMGEPIFANPRNMAAGSIRQLDPKVTAFRNLDSYAYELICDLGQKTHEEKHKILKAFGFKTNPHNKFCKNLSEVFEFHGTWREKRKTLPYEIDGLVVIVNQNDLFEKLGTVGKAPRGAIAYKFPLKESITIIEGISLQIGRTGALTPVAYLKPVEIGGTTISRATLHNEDEIKRLGVKIGDTVIVGRAGDVIPDIIKVLPGLRSGKEKEFKMPEVCPACKTKLRRKEKEVVWYCPNKNCPAIKRENFYHLVSKRAFDIIGLGPKIIDRFLDEGLISDIPDLFILKEGDIKPLERFAEKSAKNLIKAIQAKKEISLNRFLFALGIRHIGEETAYALVDYFGNLDRIKKASLEELQKVQDIGPEVSNSLYKWFKDKDNLRFLEKLQRAGVRTQYQKAKISARGGFASGGKNQKLRNKIFALTGELKIFTRDEVKEKIKELGGKVSGSVSKNTSFVVVGRNPGSKLEKAKKLGVKIIDEKMFLKEFVSGPVR